MLTITQSLDSFKFSVNPLVLNKTKDYKTLNQNFLPYEGSIDDLIEAESRGFAYSMFQYGGDGSRRKSNVTHAFGFALDFDNADENSRIDRYYLLNHPLLPYIAYITETCSSTPEHPKFRAIGVFEYPISGEQSEELAQTLLKDDFKGIDLACLESGRLFFGNNDPDKWSWKNPNAMPLPQKYIDEAIASLKIKKEIEREKAEARRIVQELPQYRSALTTEDELINLERMALSHIPPRTMRGAGQYVYQIRVAFGVLNSGLPRNIAIGLLEEWSPTNKKLGWDIEKIANSNDKARSTCNVGTVFHYAKEFGFVFPKTNKPSFQNKVTEYVKKALPKIKEVVDDLGEGEANQAFLAFLTGFSKSIVEEVKEVIRESGFAFNKPIHFYYTGGDLPTKEELAGRMVIVPDNFYQEYYEKVCRCPDIKYALDVSSTGSGKSHVAGQLQISNCFEIPEPTEGEEIKTEFHKIILSMPGHRNPTVAGIEENFPDLPARHNGYELDYDKKTALGNPFRVKATDETIPELRTQSNCHWTDHLNQIYASGRDPEKVCKVCPHFKKCKSGMGDGYGFLYQYHDAMKWQYASTSPQLISKNLFNPKTIGIFDEIDSGSYEMAKTTNFSDHDYVGFLNGINQHDPTLRDDFKAFFTGIEGVLACKELPTYGLENHDIIFGLQGVCSGLGEVPDNVDDLINRIERIEVLSRPDLGDLVKKKRTDLITAIGIGKIAQIWCGKENGSLRFNDSRISIQYKNKRMIEGIKNTSTSIMQSATVNPDWLCLQLGINKDDLLIFAKLSEVPSNLLITQVVNGFGVFNKQRDKELSEKKKAIVTAHILKKDKIEREQLGVIDYKDFADGENLTHFADGRGSNLFQSKNSVVSYGIPFPHIGSAVANYITMTGDRDFKYAKDHKNRAFTDYYKHLVRTEVLQEAGRLRANRRTDESLHYWVCGDGDLSWLELLGYRFEQTECKNISIDLCTKVEQVKIFTLKVGVELARKGKAYLDRIGVKGMAAKLGKSHSAVIQWINLYLKKEVKDAKGKAFEAFKALLVSLVDKEGGLTKHRELTKKEWGVIYEIQNTAIPYLESVTKIDAPQADIDAEIANALGLFIESYGVKFVELAFLLLPLQNKSAIAASFLNCFNIWDLGVGENTEIVTT